MARIEPDSVMGHAAPLLEGEKVVQEFRPDRAVYWRSHLVMAVILGTVAGLILMWQANPYPVVGPVAAILAIGARAAFVQSEAMGEVWRLTERRLLGPGGRAIPLAQLQTARPFMGAVQVVTSTGDKHLIRYQADPAATAARLLAAGRKAG
jgi:predicted DNA repair protein MutK